MNKQNRRRLMDIGSNLQVTKAGEGGREGDYDVEASSYEINQSWG